MVHHYSSQLNFTMNLAMPSGNAAIVAIRLPVELPVQLLLVKHGE
jgi:hypothetical protein